MKKNLKWPVLSGVLLFYAFLYIATAKSTRCEEVCQKINKVETLLQKDSAVFVASQCHTDALCIYVNDSTSGNWNGVADSACLYMNNEGLQHYQVRVIGTYNRDTLAKQTCP